MNSNTRTNKAKLAAGEASAIVQPNNFARRLGMLIAAVFALTVMLGMSVVWALAQWAMPKNASASASAASPPPLCISAEPRPPAPAPVAEPCPAIAVAMAAPQASQALPGSPDKPEKKPRAGRGGTTKSGARQGSAGRDETTGGASVTAEPPPPAEAPPAPAPEPVTPVKTEKSRNPNDVSPWN